MMEDEKQPAEDGGSVYLDQMIIACQRLYIPMLGYGPEQCAHKAIIKS
jgi:hypothetical protein